jgi:plasmid maintenance system antidote protein VapI
MGIEEALRAAIADRIANGETMHAIGVASGAGHAVLSRFINEQRTLTLPTADKLAAYLGVTASFKPVKRRKRK